MVVGLFYFIFIICFFIYFYFYFLLVAVIPLSSARVVYIFRYVCTYGAHLV